MGFGRSLLANESTLFSYRKFFPECQVTKNKGAYLVLSCLEDSTTKTKKKFEQSEIYVYENEFHTFKNDASKDSNTSETQRPNMIPPYFSSEFKLYIRYLPIINNITQCSNIDLKQWSQANKGIELAYFNYRQLKSDLFIDMKESKSSKQIEKSKDAKKSKKKSENKIKNTVKFSLGQLKTNNKLKLPKKAPFDDNKSFTAEVFIETAYSSLKNEEERTRQVLWIDYPQFPVAKETKTIVYFTFVNVKKTLFTPDNLNFFNEFKVNFTKFSVHYNYHIFVNIF